MSTVQDAIDLTSPPPVSYSPPLTHSPRHRTASPGDPSGSDRQRQKRRRLEVGSDVEYVAADPGSDIDRPRSEAQQADTSHGTILTQISTWEIPPDVVPALPTGEESPTAPPSPAPVDQSIATSSSASVPIELSDSDDPIVASPKVDPSLVMRDEPATPSRVPASSSTAIATSTPTSEPLSTYTCPICFSPPTNATLTPCGHVCCGQCLFTAVKSTIRRNMVVAMDRAPAPR